MTRDELRERVARAIYREWLGDEADEDAAEREAMNMIVACDAADAAIAEVVEVCAAVCLDKCVPPTDWSAARACRERVRALAPERKP